jgi:hypothetical protein
MAGGMEGFQSYKLVCEGGLNSNQNYLFMSERAPGQATTLVNFEPSLFGGYRRINGFEPLEASAPEVDPTNAEGKILGVSIFVNDIIAARKQKSGDTYNFYRWATGAPWAAYTTGLTLSTVNMDKIRYDTFNFDGTDKIVFVDGANGVIVFDGTNWTQPTGDQSIADPKFVTIFKNTVFVSGDTTSPQLVVYSKPLDESDWNVASGAGQINAGFNVKQIMPFRDELYVFGETQIKKIVIDGTDFVLQDVTKNIGLVASDGVQEINGDLLFLAQDGFRTIAGTNRIGDVELAVQSKDIQQDVIDLVLNADLPSVNSVIVRRKSQFRCFFSDANLSTEKNNGIMGGLVGNDQGIGWSWSKLKGIRTSVCTSGYILTEEFVLHGDYNGKVYRQEEGTSFDGAAIPAVYTTPYNDFGESQIRKTLHKISVFIRAEGELTLTAAIQYDWNSQDVFNPDTYVLVGNVSGVVYGQGVYGTSKYATTVLPLLIKNIEGSGFSNRITFSTNDTNDCYSIQGIVYEYAVNGRK